MRRFAVGLCLLTGGLLPAQDRTLFRSPALNRTHIAFEYAGDLWSVPRTGGEAVRVTSGPGVKSGPVFSPDGSMIAFTGRYEGDTDVYVVPAAGGIPKRLTYRGGPDFAAGWMPDGKRVVFVSTAACHNGRPRMFTVDLNAGFPQEIPLPSGTMPAFSPDGKRLVYSPLAPADAIWKNYRGGRATLLWIADLADSSITKIPRTDSNDSNPMWVGSHIYFISDRDGRKSLYEYDLALKKVTRLIENRGLDIKSASAWEDAIAYEQFGEIHLFDPKSKKDVPVKIVLNGDLASARPRMQDVKKNIQNMQLSPTGVRAVFEARGDIFTVPAEKGDIRDLTKSSGVADRDPAWSPDGKSIAYFSDESGEYQLVLRDQSGLGEVKRIALGTPPAFYYGPTWSPDSKKIAYTDNHSRLWYVDVEKKAPVLVDTCDYSGRIMAGQGPSLYRPSWSPDSKWLAFTRQLSTGVGAVFVYSPDAPGPARQITDGMSDAADAVWDKNGKYLYFSASTDDGPLLIGIDLSNINRPVSRSLYAVVLKKEDPSPFAPESDEEKIDAKKTDEKKGDVVVTQGDSAKDAKKDDKKPEKIEVRIDFNDIGYRIVPVPVPARNYVGLTTAKEGVLFYLERPVSQFASSGPQSVILNRFDLSKRKAEPFLTGVRNFVVSANGEKILMNMGEDRFVLTGTASAPKPGEGQLKLDGMETIIDPVAEWKQMYKEAWRIERDFFYDPAYHGLDLQAAEETYAWYVKSVGDPSDLLYLFQEMLGQLSVGHLYIFRPDDASDGIKPVKGGLLGADYKLENGRYRFARVYSGESWNPDTRAPLTQPGVDVKAGEYLLAVNGRDLRDSDNVYQFFEGTAGKHVVLKVGPNPNGEGSREVTVVPVENEVPLRTLAWVEDNRRKVDELSGGKLAYIHLPDTGNNGYAYFNRYYYAQTDKQGAVLDERHNRGGMAADYVIDALRRPVWNYWTRREGAVFTSPTNTPDRAAT